MNSVDCRDEVERNGEGIDVTIRKENTSGFRGSSGKLQGRSIAGRRRCIEYGGFRSSTGGNSKRGLAMKNLVWKVMVTGIFPFGFLSVGLAQQASVSSRPPGIVYVSNGGGGISEVNTSNNAVIATAPFPNNANGVVITPDGRRMYASNRDVGQVTVFDTQTNVPLTIIPVGNGSNDNLGLAISPDGELVYVANQASNTVTVIDTQTNNVSQVIPTGLQPIWITFSPSGSRAYVSNQADGSISVIATASGMVINNIGGFSCPFQSVVTHDGSKLLVSSQCDNSLKVVSLDSNTIVNSIPTGPNPRGIALTPDARHAYVADFFANTVDVIDVAAQSNLNTPLTVGANPWGVAMTPAGKLYVANFGDNTISVIDSSTNAVTATLAARGNPEDITVSTTTRPTILGYNFQTIAPTSSPYSLVRSLNAQGDAVGDFLDANFGFHGFLRTQCGAFQSIDPPGAVATSAFAINDLGTIVGAFIDSNGALHGFRRSPSGAYTTVDFPSEPDSQLTGINNGGRSIGVYDLGSRDSTQCPGPSCQAISFLLHSGQFTSFQDPAAVAGVTFAQSINDLGQIAGLFQDAAGNVKGFLRSPVDGSFRTIQFPFANAFSYVEQINNLGIMAGEYHISSVEQGFLTDGTNALSVDYPNSNASGLRAVNSLGEIGGFQVATPGGPEQAYIATLVAATPADE
jgi:YVTN family beta-propeller protein